jgi:hypothetical protein
MISCDAFRLQFAPGTEEANVLEHLRSCDRCLEFAVQVDPDAMFRALGGELDPPGGVDAFVDGVMQQVRVRGAESTVRAHRVMSWPRRLAIAATVVVGFTASVLMHRANITAPEPVGIASRGRIASPAPDASGIVLATKPVVETYESQNATIVEMPAEKAGDVQIVMIFDENLPADL